MDFEAPNSVFKIDQYNIKQTSDVNFKIKRDNVSTICVEFSQLSDTKLIEGIFDGPQIRKLLKDDVFVTKMTSTEKRAWLIGKILQDFFCAEG